MSRTRQFCIDHQTPSLPRQQRLFGSSRMSRSSCDAASRPLAAAVPRDPPFGAAGDSSMITGLGARLGRSARRVAARSAGGPRRSLRWRCCRLPYFRGRDRVTGVDNWLVRRRRVGSHCLLGPRLAQLRDPGPAPVRGLVLAAPVDGASRLAGLSQVVSEFFDAWPAGAGAAPAARWAVPASCC